MLYYCNVVVRQQHSCMDARRQKLFFRLMVMAPGCGVEAGDRILWLFFLLSYFFLFHVKHFFAFFCIKMEKKVADVYTRSSPGKNGERQHFFFF